MHGLGKARRVDRDRLVVHRDRLVVGRLEAGGRGVRPGTRWRTRDRSTRRP